MSLDGIFLCSSGWSCTYYSTEADLELLAIALIQSPRARITGVSPHTQLIRGVMEMVLRWPVESKNARRVAQTEGSNARLEA